MAFYSYQARDPQGKRLTGVLEAENLGAVVDSLSQKGYLVTRIKPKLSLLPSLEGKWPGSASVKLRDLVVFTRQFSSLINAGIPLNRTLPVLYQQTASRRLQKIVSEVQKEINRGLPLYVALNQHPEAFDKLYVQMIKTGEIAGILDSILQKLADVTQKELTLRSKIKAAVLYPLMIVLIALGVVTFLITFVLPNFINTFLHSGMSLPLPTQILLSIASFLNNYFWLLPVGGLLGWFFGRWFRQTQSGGILLDRLVFKVPVFGKLASQITTARFASALAALLSSGVPVLQALEVVEETVTNRVFKAAVAQVRQSITEGENLAAPLLSAGFFQPLLIQMIAVGEETGNLDAMLVQVAEHCENEVNLAVAALIPLIEPLLILIVAAMVGFIVLSIFLPMLGMMSAIGY